MAFKLKSLFVKDEGEDTKVAEKPTQPQQRQTNQNAPITTVFGNLAGSGGGEAAASMPQMGSGTVSTNDYVSQIEEKIKSVNQAGLDYLEFTDALKKFEGKPVADKEKYEYSFMPFESMNIVPGALVDSAEKYLKELDAFKNDFDTQWNDTFQKEVTDKEKEAANLQKQIQELTLKAQTLGAEAGAMKFNLQAEQNAFNLALSSKVGQINNHNNNIKTYLHANVTAK